MSVVPFSQLDQRATPKPHRARAYRVQNRGPARKVETLAVDRNVRHGAFPEADGRDVCELGDRSGEFGRAVEDGGQRS